MFRVAKSEVGLTHLPEGRSYVSLETSYGVVPGGLGVRQFAHNATPGGKIRRLPWNKSAGPWSSAACRR